MRETESDASTRTGAEHSTDSSTDGIGFWLWCTYGNWTGNIVVVGIRDSIFELYAAIACKVKREVALVKPCTIYGTANIGFTPKRINSMREVEV